MKEITVKLSMFMVACLLVGAAIAGTASSNEFKLDCRTGIRTAVVPEHIQYSTAWATNLTAAQQANATAVVKVNPCLKTPPKYLVVDMSGGRNAARWPISYLDEVPEGGWSDEYKTEKLVLRYIPAGSFIMGGRATDYPGAVNTNLHMVTLTKPFYIGVFECTQRQWELAMGTRPSFFTNETCYATRPVEQVSTDMIRGAVLGRNWPKNHMVDEGSFVEIFRSKTGMSMIDLPTEAQWEYACRAGTSTAMNNGKNLPTVGQSDVADEIARYAFNSGWVANGKKLTSVFSNATTTVGTATVGSYLPNAWGLYDMHGNVWELCLDVWIKNRLLVGHVDPVGFDDTVVFRVPRGGSYVHPNNTRGVFELCSGYREETKNVTTLSHDTGFRVCLHDANLSIPDSATVLVNATGPSAADWTPTQAGTYQLTHEVQVDGVTVAPMEGALFKVEGPELAIVPMGELTNGVAVKVEGVGVDSGWQVYYTTDGSAPTAASTLYEGPFALPESATVRAVAISEAGMRSDEARADFTLHDALSVVGAVARQRYPWNGMVDIDCEITGDSNCVYVVEVVATDLDGGTNLPVKTVHMAARPESAPYRLSPGKYRFTWNADADIEGDFDFANVSVSVSAKGGPLVGYARQMTISTDGYTGSETLTNVPVLVRLSTSIDGFDYNDFASPSNGADIVFMDEAETQVLPYEIDEWHTNGESLVWVKLPELNRGTKFMLAYGNSQPSTLNSQLSSHEVWREYAGVWHMNEDSGTAFDSTEHGLDALPDCGENGDISQMVAYENGACGMARVNASANVGVKGNSLVIPAYDALVLGDTFSVSGWFHIDEMSGPQSLVSRKKSWTADDGWECVAIVNDDNNPALVARGRGTTNFAIPRPDMDADFVQVALVYQSNELKCYTNGVLSAEGAIEPATDNELPLSFGSNPGKSRSSLCGQYDEIRLRGGTLSADRIKTDYDMIANKNFCTYLVVKE